jgi:hypothetical protein
MGADDEFAESGFAVEHGAGGTVWDESAWPLRGEAGLSMRRCMASCGYGFVFANGLAKEIWIFSA